MALRGKFQRPQNRPATIEYTEKGLSKLCCKTQRNLESPLFQAFFSTYVPEKAFSVCIKDSVFIDPPYNTGNEGWVYNDNVNDPKIKKWLGEVVGKEGEDLTRHDKWLCMMYPRLKLLQKLLADDGVIFISIDDTEYANLKLICDEIFGSNCFVSNISWQRTYSTRNDSKGIVNEVEHLVVYGTDNKSGKRGKGYRWEWGKYTTKLIDDFDNVLAALIALKNNDNEKFVNEWSKSCWQAS